MDELTIKYYRDNATQIATKYDAITSGLSEYFFKCFLPNSKILDIGCGSGRDLATLIRLGHDCFGVDPIKEFVSLSQKSHPELSGRIVEGALPDLPIPFGGEFDAVLCSAVLMHVPSSQLKASALAILKCLKPNGRLLFSVPTKRLDVVANDRDANGRLFLPNQSELLQQILKEAGFKTIARWSNSDSLGRQEVEWESVLMILKK